MRLLGWLLSVGYCSCLLFVVIAVDCWFVLFAAVGF